MPKPEPPAFNFERPNVAGVCINCNGIVWIGYFGDDLTQTVIHTECPEPAVVLWLDHPKRLGVITGIGDGEA